MTGRPHEEGGPSLFSGIVTATVVSSCKVNAPRQADPSRFSTMPVAITCARGRVAPRVQRPSPAPRRSEVRDAVLVIDF